MAWTDERVQRLRDLWAAGQSASQIAGDLGGVTRNAVIGKVHRLGLSGKDRTGTGAAAQAVRAAQMAGKAASKSAGKPARKAASKPAPTSTRKPTRAKSAPRTRAPIAKPATAPQRKVAPAARVRPPAPEPVSRARTAPSAPRIPQAVRDMAGRPFQAPQEAIRLDDGKFATVLTITDHMCKWPIGDPGAEDFRFCGRRTDPEEPYCTAHSRVAYQPSRRRGGGSNKALPPVMRRKAIR